MASNNTHLHYIVWAYERVEPGTGNYLDNTVVDVIVESEAKALTKAKGLVKKHLYCVRTVVEHFDGQPCSKA